MDCDCCEIGCSITIAGDDASSYGTLVSVIEGARAVALPLADGPASNVIDLGNNVVIFRVVRVLCTGVEVVLAADVVTGISDSSSSNKASSVLFAPSPVKAVD